MHPNQAMPSAISLWEKYWLLTPMLLMKKSWHTKMLNNGQAHIILERPQQRFMAIRQEPMSMLAPTPMPNWAWQLLLSRQKVQLTKPKPRPRNLLMQVWLLWNSCRKQGAKGTLFLKEKPLVSDYRADLVIGDKIISFNFKDAPYFGIDYSDSDTISELDPDGSLAKAGLKKGDKVISIDGKPVSSLNEFLTIGRLLEIGQTVKVEYQRHGKTKTVPMTIYNAP